MPTYDYRCEANGETVEVSHPMGDSVRTWGDLCRRVGLDLGGTPDDASVEKCVPLVAARSAQARPPQGPCGSACGCFPN